MVPEEHLTRVQGLNQMMQGALNIVSAPAGALLLAVLPVQGVLGIDVLTAVIAITIIFFIHVPQPENQRSQSAQTLREFNHEFQKDLKAGLRYVWSWPALMIIMVMAMFINLLLNPAFSLMPLLVTDHFGGDALHFFWPNYGLRSELSHPFQISANAAKEVGQFVALRDGQVGLRSQQLCRLRNFDNGAAVFLRECGKPDLDLPGVQIVFVLGEEFVEQLVGVAVTTLP